MVPKWSPSCPKIVPKLSQNGPKVVPNWSQNGPKVVPKWSITGPKMVPKWSQRGPKVVPKWSQNGPKMVPKWSQSSPKMVPKWSQNGPKMVPKWSQSRPKLVPKWSLSGPKVVPKWSVHYFRFYRVKKGVATIPAAERRRTIGSIRVLIVDESQEFPDHLGIILKVQNPYFLKQDRFRCQLVPRTDMGLETIYPLRGPIKPFGPMSTLSQTFSESMDLYL